MRSADVLATSHRPRATPDSRRYWLLLASCALPNALLVALINVALPEIQAAFGVSSSALAWAASGYIVAGAVGAVVYGRLADVLGTRTAASWCIVGFVLASIVVAAAPTYSVLVTARVGQGLFGMALPVLALAAVVSDVPAVHRTRALGLVMVAFGVAAVGGSLGGGFLVTFGSWRLPFLVSGVIGAALLVPIRRTIPARRASATRPTFDVRGGCIAAVAVAATLLAANQIPRVDGTRVGGAAVVAAVAAWTLFARWISRVSDPFIDPIVLRSPRFLLVCGLGGAMQAMFVATGFVASLALHDVHGRSTSAIGVLLAPGFAAVLVGGLVCRRLVTAFGERLVVSGGVAIGVLGAAITVSMGASSISMLVVAYVCLGMAYTTTQAVLMRRAGELMPGTVAATGMGFYNFAYFASGALGVAVAGGTIERRLIVDDAWNPFFDGAGAPYADAFAVLFTFTAVAIVLLVELNRRRVFPVAGEA